MKQSFILPANLRRDGVIQRIANLLTALPLDKAFRFEIEEHKSKRTTQQNRYLWGCVYPAIAKHLEGWDLDDIHEYFLGECFGWEKLTGFSRARLRPIKRSSRLNKLEFSDYVGFIQRRAAEHGIFIPDADPDYWEHDRVEAA